MRNLLSRCAVVLSLALVSPAQAQGEVLPFAPDDPAMNAAMAEAQSYLDRVLAAAIGEDGAGHPALMLKVAFPVEAGDMTAEVIWVNEVRHSGSGFRAKLGNAPVNMPGLALGAPVEFTAEMIRDWSLTGASGRAYGHFTTRVLVKQLPADQAEDIRKVLTDDPVPAAWR